MKYSDFQYETTIKADSSTDKNMLVDIASVLVESGSLWWKKAERRKAYRWYGHWRFLDTGELAPSAFDEMSNAAYVRSQIK